MKNYGLCFFADEWGATKGGINTFNYDLCLAIGKLSNLYDVKVICVCSNSISQKTRNDALGQGVELVALDKTDFNQYNFQILQNYIQDCANVFSIGHDKITAKHCKAFQKQFNCKTVIFHHMDYEAYYGASALGVEVKEKILEQRESLSGVDFLVAVGPKLYTSLCDKSKEWNLQSKIGQIVPGLSEICPSSEILSRFRVLVSGRIEEKNDKIKQYGITLEAYCRLHKEDSLSDGSSLTLLGLDNSDKDNLEKNLRKRASNLAEGFVNIFPLPYTSDRNEYYEVLKGSSVVTMPSISEGFGLIGLEAISAGIPLILTKNSGLYELLCNLGLTEFVEAINIKGHLDKNPNPTDVENMYKALKSIRWDYENKKQRALKLRKKLLEKNVTWNGCSEKFFSILGIEIETSSKALTSLLSDEVLKISSFKAIAENCLNKFWSELETIDKIDCSSLKSTKIDNIDELQLGIMRLSTVRRRHGKINLLNKIIILLEDFFTQVVQVIFQSECSSKFILVENLLSSDKERIKIEKIEWRYIFDFEELPSSHVLEIAQEVLIKAALSREEKTCLVDYHNLISKEHEYLDFEGLSIMISNDAAVRIPLKRIFAEVTLNSDNRLRDNYLTKDHYVRQFIEDKHSLILGDPGTGKSTLLQKIILEACDSQCFRMCLPIKIASLSDWLKGQSSQATLEDYIINACLKNKHNNEDILIETYKKLKKMGGLFVVLDGYDEVQKSTEKKQITHLINKYFIETPESVFVISSRIVGYDNNFERLNFKQYKVVSLKERSIIDYIRKWYSVMGEMHPGQKEKFIKKSNNLIGTIRKDESIRALAQNPLLLSILVILHYHGINLPNNKVKLYQTITNTLLETWIERKGIIQDRYTVDFLTMFFSNVAYKIVCDNYDTMLITEHSLKKLYSDYISEKGYIINASNDEENEFKTFIEYISESLGVLLKRGVGLKDENLYGFLMHRQFTEYFAAIKLEEIIDNDDIELQTIAFNPKWIEIIILMVGYMNNQQGGGQKRANRIINKLLSLSSRPLEALDYNLQLALKIMSNNVYLEVDVKKTILDKIDCIFKQNNPYKILQFSSDLISLSNSIYKEFLFKNIINESLLSNDYKKFRSACMIINEMYSYQDEFIDASFLSNNETLIFAMQKLFINEKNTDGFFTSKDSFFQNFFEKTFIDTINLMEDTNSISEENIDHLFDLTKLFASANIYNRITYDANLTREEQRLLVIKNEFHKIKNNDLAHCFLTSIVLLNYGYDLAINEDTNVAKLLMYVPECQPLIDGCKKLFIESLPSNITSVLWIIGNFRISHYVDDTQENVYNILLLEKDVMVRFDFKLPHDFSIKELESELEKIGADKKRFALPCLNVTSNDEMSASCLQTLFDYAFENEYLLYRNKWAPLLLTKALSNDEIIYKNYSLYIAINIFRNINSAESLTQLGKIIRKLFSRQSTPLSAKDNNWLIKQYKLAVKEDNPKQFILYDLLNRANNPFRNLQENAEPEYDF